MGVDDSSALQYLQKKLDNILEEKHKMSVNVKVQQPEAPVPQPEEEKQEDEAPVAPDMQAVLEEIMKRLAAIEDVVFPKETSMDTEEEKESKDVPPPAAASEVETLIAKELKKFFDKLGVSSTQRPLAKSEAPPAPKLNLKDLSYAEIARLRLEADPKYAKMFLRHDTR